MSTKVMVKIKRKLDASRTNSVNAPNCSRQFDPNKDEFDVPQSELLSIVHNGNFVVVKALGSTQPKTVESTPVLSEPVSDSDATKPSN